jgi:hypothetical protein
VKSAGEDKVHQLIQHINSLADDSIENLHLNDDSGTIIVFPGETF